MKRADLTNTIKKFRDDKVYGSKCNCGTCNCNCGSQLVSTNVINEIKKIVK